MSEATASVRTRVRINVAKTATKGYTADTTVEVEWAGLTEEGDADTDGRLGEMLALADRHARDEIARRAALDAKEVGP